MKIQVQLSNDQLTAVDLLLRELYSIPHNNQKDVKVTLSVGYDLADKFHSKYCTQIKNSSLFDNSKRHKFKLKFHEAFALEQLLIILKHKVNEYYQPKVQTLINDLNQKMA